MILRLSILLVIALSTVTAENSCVIYQLDKDFVNNHQIFNCFSNKNEMASQNIVPSSKDGTSALLLAARTCASTNIGSLSSGILESEVYISSHSCVVDISISDSSGSDLKAIATNSVKLSDNNLGTGWRTLSLDIIRDINNAEIKWQTSCNKGFVLIESFKHIPQEGKTQLCNNASPVKSMPNDLTIHSKEKRSVRDPMRDVEYSGLGAGDMADVTAEFRNIDEDSSFWTPLTIGLITSAGFALLALLAIGAYHCGKVKGADELNAALWNEPIPTITIPRARSIYSQSCPSVRTGRSSTFNS